MMLPALVLPFHDPVGLMLPYLWQVEPWLKDQFEAVYIGLTHRTEAAHPQAVRRLQKDPFYVLNFNPADSLPGEHYRSVYRNAVENTKPQQRLHLCDFDRLAYALLSEQRSAFLADFAWANQQVEPLQFQRSPKAWETHPDNYRAIEGLVIQVGEMLFGRYYDFGWSYLTLQSADLAWLLPQLVSRDFGVLIETVLLLQPRLLTRQVDWLEWEDPFFLGQNAETLRANRSQDRQETLKRLRGILPFFRHFLEKTPELRMDLKWEREPTEQPDRVD